jgi:hypothetical protein
VAAALDTLVGMSSFFCILMLLTGVPIMFIVVTGVIKHRKTNIVTAMRAVEMSTVFIDIYNRFAKDRNLRRTFALIFATGLTVGAVVQVAECGWSCRVRNQLCGDLGCQSTYRSQNGSR